MGTISEKLVYLNGTKQAIKQAINEDFEVINDNTTFREYAEEISFNNAKYKDLIPKVNVNATNTLDISNSSGLDKALVTQYGNTYQETTTGKNLFDKDNANTINVFVNNTTNKLVITYEGTGCFYIPCEANTTYTVSKTELFGNDRFCVFDTTRVPTVGDTILSFVGNRAGVDTHTSYTITTTATATYLGVFVKASTNPNKTMQEIAETIQIEKSSSATSYEKYTGGNPAPNPDYPQDIHVVSGDNSIEVVGKNLLSGIEQGTLNSSGEPTYSTTAIRSKNFDSVLPNTQYTISINGTATPINVAQYDSNKSFISFTYYNGTFTTSANTHYIKITKGGSVTDLFQVEQNSQATTYEPYQGSSYPISLGDIELCKIGTYKDRIYPLNGKWYLHKEIGKVVLNGSESWTLASSNTNTTRFYRHISDIINGTTDSTLSKLFSDYFKPTTFGLIYNGDEPSISQYGGNQDALRKNIYIRIDNTLATTVSGFKTWLSTHNTILYYVLATPTTEEITESNYPTLYNQLNNIKLFEGVNHLTFTNESGLDVEFDIEYYKDWKLD